MIKNIIFDVGGVLVSFRQEEYLKRLGFDETTRTAVQAALFQNPLWNEHDRGAHTQAEYEDMFVANDPAYETQIRRAYGSVGDAIERFSYSEDWIKELKSSGYDLYVLSNYGDRALGQTLHKLTFLSDMDGVIFSCKVKSIKPEREIYERLLREYGLIPEECVFIDDREDNIKVAESFGIHGIIFRNYAQASAELERMLSETE